MIPGRLLTAVCLAAVAIAAGCGGGGGGGGGLAGEGLIVEGVLDVNGWVTVTVDDQHFEPVAGANVVVNSTRLDEDTGLYGGAVSYVPGQKYALSVQAGGSLLRGEVVAPTGPVSISEPYDGQLHTRGTSLVVRWTSSNSQVAQIGVVRMYGDVYGEEIWKSGWVRNTGSMTIPGSVFSQAAEYKLQGPGYWNTPLNGNVWRSGSSFWFVGTTANEVSINVQ